MCVTTCPGLTALLSPGDMTRERVVMTNEPFITQFARNGWMNPRTYGHHRFSLGSVDQAVVSTAPCCHVPLSSCEAAGHTPGPTATTACPGFCGPGRGEHSGMLPLCSERWTGQSCVVVTEAY